MISIRDSKFIKSLQLKKFRSIENRFIVEGAKNVLELLNSDLLIHSLYATEDFSTKNASSLNDFNGEKHSATASELKKVGTFTNNNAVLAVVEIPTYKSLNLEHASVLAFDRIKDPGNLGTIIRIADWYQFDNIICSPDSVDCYNAKVISASMGSFTRVKVHYLEIEDVIKKAPYVYGTTLQGESIHDINFKAPSIVLFGNESTGIDDHLKQYIHQEVKIPGYGQAESLNVAISTAVFCDNYKRKVKP
jgi:TrmH family RNA methyltransferase